MAQQFTILEKNILKAKGLGDADLETLAAAGVGSRADFETVGDAATLGQLLPDISADTARNVMAWALGTSAAAAPAVGGGKVTIDTADVVYCLHCGAKQPKDYKSGDLCISCGKQAEPTYSCYWCASSGPGKFCRQCGAEFTATADLDLALLLKRDGLPKDDIAKRLKAMSPAEKDELWGRVRKLRG